MRPPHGDPRARALAALFDADSTTEIGARLGPTDLLKFKDQKKYSERIKIAQKNTGEYDALIAMRGLLKGRALVASSFDFAFMGGSMGSVVGSVSRWPPKPQSRSVPRMCASRRVAARACRKACSR